MNEEQATECLRLLKTLGVRDPYTGTTLLKVSFELDGQAVVVHKQFDMPPPLDQVRLPPSDG